MLSGPCEPLISHAHFHIDAHSNTCVLGEKKTQKWLLKLLSLHFPHIYSIFGILKQYTVHGFSYCYLGGKYERRQKWKKKRKKKDFGIHEIYSQIPGLLQTVSCVPWWMHAILLGLLMIGGHHGKKDGVLC